MKLLIALYALFIGGGVIKLKKKKKSNLEITVFIVITSVGCILWLCILLHVPLDTNQIIKIIFDRIL